MLLQRLRSCTRQSEGGIMQFLGLLSAISSFFIFLDPGTSALSAYSVNIRPLMASVGGVGMAVRLATQSLTTNFVSAFSLGSSRRRSPKYRKMYCHMHAPGVVLQIEPLWTVTRDNDGWPVYLTNSEVTRYAVRNFTQGTANRAA